MTFEDQVKTEGRQLNLLAFLWKIGRSVVRLWRRRKRVAAALLLGVLGGCAPSLLPMTPAESLALSITKPCPESPGEMLTICVPEQCDWSLVPAAEPAAVLKDGTRLYPAVWVFPAECGAKEAER